MHKARNVWDRFSDLDVALMKVKKRNMKDFDIWMIVLNNSVYNVSPASFWQQIKIFLTNLSYIDENESFVTEELTTASKHLKI